MASYSQKWSHYSQTGCHELLANKWTLTVKYEVIILKLVVTNRLSRTGCHELLANKWPLMIKNEVIILHCEFWISFISLLLHSIFVTLFLLGFESVSFYSNFCSSRCLFCWSLFVCVGLFSHVCYDLGLFSYVRYNIILLGHESVSFYSNLYSSRCLCWSLFGCVGLFPYAYYDIGLFSFLLGHESVSFYSNWYSSKCLCWCLFVCLGLFSYVYYNIGLFLYVHYDMIACVLQYFNFCSSRCM